MEQIVVKTEVQPNGELLLFYLDENAVNDPNNMLSIQNIPQEEELEQQEETYIYEDEDDDGEDIDISQLNEEEYSKENWSDEETQRLLVFYIDNKETFLNGAAKKKRLWAIACQTMITAKKPDSCAMKLEMMKKKYVKSYLEVRKGMEVTWPYYNLCQVAFADDEYVKLLISQGEQEQYMKLTVEPPKNDGIIIVKQVSSRSPADEKVEAMLKSYLKHKKKFRGEHLQKSLWQIIATEIGDSNEADYWHRRFLNFKQHYIRMLENRVRKGPNAIHWPYMGLFDQIFGDDHDFNKKYNLNEQEKELTVIVNQNVMLDINLQNEWNDTEVTVLVKYFFDCFEDFQDPTIPNNFLWTEVGRLLDKGANDCKEMYDKMKLSYFEQRLKDNCDLRNRSALIILFDHIVSKETEIELLSIESNPDRVEVWKTHDTDELVQFFCNQIEMFKDPICYYVCWALVKLKLNKNLASCRHQWEELTTLYKSILHDKKEYPDMQIDWRYTELFDQIFDYGTDENLLAGYDKKKKESMQTAKKSDDATIVVQENDETKQPRGVGDAKVFKILEYYLKNKEKFIQPGKKLKLWEILSKDVGMPASEIDHRFRNLKQVYTSYIQREINKPEMPILWPYFNLCKKVFGYRAIKSKLKNSKEDNDDEWSAKEIKLLIKYATTNINVHSENIDESQFTELAGQIDKTEKSCSDKYIELRKSYKKLKMMKERNNDVKVTWKYYNAFDQAFNNRQYMDMDTENEINNLQMIEGDQLESILSQYGSVNEGTDDEYTIIVIPEGQEVTQASIEEQFNATRKAQSKWHLRSKRSLLIHYLNYVKTHKGLINQQEMWQYITSKFPDKPHCKKMFLKLKSSYIKLNEQDRKQNLYHDLLEKVINVKPKFLSKLNEESVCEDVELPSEKLEKALRYYLEHHEEFVSARFEKKYVWTELAKLIREPIKKVFDKITYLKKGFSNEARQTTEFDELLREIILKENEFVVFGENLPEPSECKDELPWNDLEVEQLLTWYLLNLDKFKSPKYVRKYLWLDAGNFINRSPLSCSNKMKEIRAKYRNIMKELPEKLSEWKFFDLCQKIYGTGKKVST